MNKKDMLYTFISLIISSAIFLVGYTKVSDPVEVYRVYLKGETIGYVKDKELLEEYIDKEQFALKEKYKVDKVFLPNDLDIVREITYSNNVSTEKEIYEKIKDIAPFTINGFTITIKGVEVQAEDEEEPTLLEDRKIYVLDRNLFETAVKNTVHVFIPEEEYNTFVNDNQEELKENIVLTEGSHESEKVIEDIYIKNSITITEGRISAEEKIFTDIEELNKYMLFGTLDEQGKYQVQKGDSITNIAFNNKLSVEEFLIANPEFTSANNLLSEVQVVNLKVKQQGENGTLKLTKKVQKINGQITSAVITKTDVIKPSIPKIIVKGSKVVPNVGNVGVWGWPTAKPYCITSPYGWRWGKLHEAFDISCTGCGSPIYAANNGTVETAKYTWPNGNYIVINHNNGYYSIYAHLGSLGVQQGQVVQMGDQIGTMGSTGYSTGCHLHFGISSGFPYRGSYQFYNPGNFY